MAEIPYNYLVPRVGHLMARGARLQQRSVARIEYDAAGRCEAPVAVTQEGRPYRHQRSGKILVLETMTRCRRCPPCLEARRREWTRRAVIECERSHRIWFGTLTLRPGVYAYAVMRARLHYKKADVSFVEITEVIGRELTKLFKRVRTNHIGAKLKYLLVTEAHKSGVPHFHMLLMEQNAVQVSKRTLEAEWVHGFTKWKLADKGTARYVCKYLAKEAATRVRASRFFGSLEERKLRPHDIAPPPPGEGEACKMTGNPLDSVTAKVDDAI